MSLNDETSEVLASSPYTYKLKLQGFGGTVVMGKIDPKIYKYFRNHIVDVADFSCEKQNTQQVPEEFWPFDPGRWSDCSEIALESGVEMDEACFITVEDTNNTVVWTSSLDPAVLEELGCDIECSGDTYASDLPTGNVVFYGQEFSEGVFVNADLNLDAPFDATKLKITYADIEGWSVCSSIEYNGEQIDVYDFSIKEKSSHFAFIKILNDNDTESYTSEDDRDEYIWDDLDGE